MLRSRSLRALVAVAIAAAFIPLIGYASDRDPGPIRVSPDGRFLTENDGEPFFWLADTGWDLFRALTVEEAEAYLDDRSRRGFNIIQASAVFGGYGAADALEGRNRYGQAPFVHGSLSKPNPAYFGHVDRVIDLARARGLRVALHPIWAADNIARPNFLTEERARAYGRWLATRYRGKNLIWVLGGDWGPVAPAKWGREEVTDFRPIWDAMAAGIAAGEQGEPFILYHPNPIMADGAAESRTSLFFSRRAWLDMNAIQSGHVADSSPEWQGGYLSHSQRGEFISAYNYEIVSKEYWSRPVRPVIDFEVRYEHPSSCVPKLPRTPCWRDRDVRGAAYQAVFAGAAGHSYGNYSIWDFFDPNRPRAIAEYELQGGSMLWRDALAASAGDDMRHLKALMLSRPYFDRIPDQSVIVSPASAGDRHVAATRGRAGSYLMVYLPQGQRVAVDLTKISSPLAVGWWFDPRTGKATRIEGRWATNDRRAFTPPTTGDDQDWVLVLDDASRSFDPPGSVK